MGCCVNRSELEPMVGSPEKINRVTFNELRGFRKTKDINE